MIRVLALLLLGTALVCTRPQLHRKEYESLPVELMSTYATSTVMPMWTVEEDYDDEGTERPWNGPEFEILKSQREATTESPAERPWLTSPGQWGPEWRWWMRIGTSGRTRRPERVARDARPRPERVARDARPRPERVARDARPRPERVARDARPRPERVARDARPRPAKTQGRP